MRSRRRVTIAPIATPSRSLKPAMDFLARVITGFCPVMLAELFDGGVEQLRVLHRLAQPHVHHDLVQTRHFHGVLQLELLHQRGNDLTLVALEQRGTLSAIFFNHLRVASPGSLSSPPSGCPRRVERDVPPGARRAFGRNCAQLSRTVPLLVDDANLSRPLPCGSGRGWASPPWSPRASRCSRGSASPSR